MHFTSDRIFARVGEYLASPWFVGIEVTASLGDKAKVVLHSPDCQNPTLPFADDVLERMQSYHKPAFLVGTAILNPHDRGRLLKQGVWDAQAEVLDALKAVRLVPPTPAVVLMPEAIFCLGGTLKPERVFGALDVAKHFGLPPTPVERLQSYDEAELWRILRGWRDQWAFVQGVKLYPLADYDPDGRETNVTYARKVVHLRPKDVEARATIKRVAWRTLHDGVVYPFGETTHPVALRTEGEDDIPVGDLPLIHSGHMVGRGIGEGAVVRLAICPWRNMPVVTDVLDATPHPAPRVPEKCPECEEAVLVGLHGIGTCSSIRCPAKSRTAIVNLCTLADPWGRDDRVKIYPWLDRFPVRGSEARIDDVVTFLRVFADAGPKDTAARWEVLGRLVGGDDGDQRPLRELEVALAWNLDVGLTFQDFWWISGLPHMKWGVAKELAAVDPREVAAVDVVYVRDLRPDLNKLLTEHKKQWTAVLNLVKIAGQQRELGVVEVGDEGQGGEDPRPQQRDAGVP